VKTKLLVKRLKLFEPITIGNVTIRNRIVMPGMDTNFGDEKGQATERNLKYYELRSKGGAGLIIAEATYFDVVGRGTLRMLSAESDRKIPHLRKVAESIKKYGALAMIQVYHAGIQATSFITGEQIVGPSDVPSTLTGVIPQPLTKKMIKKLTANYAQACLRVKKAGFDGVEIHAGHGYLINQFFSPLYNKRNDEYGGSLENRMRIALEILAAIRDKCGQDFIIGFRLNCRDYIEGGLEVEEMTEIAIALEKKGVDLINITAGIFDSPYYPVVPFMNIPRGVYSDYSAIIKRAVDKVPVCVVGRINTPEIAEKILQEGKADLVAMGRALIVDPFFPKKVQAGKRDEMIVCPACNACLNQILIEESLKCAINPNVLGTDDDIGRTTDSKKVLIVGAGPGGLEAARVAKLRGHKVLLIDSKDKIGGSLLLAKVSPMKSEINNVLDYYEKTVEKLAIPVKLNTAFNEKIVEDFKPNVAILATGSKIQIPVIAGMIEDQISTYEEVLSGNIPKGNTVLILNGGMIGIEVADYLTSKGKSVIIVEESSVLGADLYSLVGSEIVQQTFDNKLITVHVGTSIKEIKKNEAILVKDTEEKIVSFDSIVIASEPKPFCDIEDDLKKLVPKVFKIGDCKRKRVRKMLDAIHEGYEISLTLETAEPPKIVDDSSFGDGLRGIIVNKVKSGTFGLEDIPEYLEVLVEICNENKKIQSKSKKSKLNFQFKIIPGPGFWIKIDNGKFSTGEGILETNDVLIEMDKSIAAGIFTGEVNAASAYMSKQIKFIGPLRHGMKFQAWTNTVKKELGLE